MTKIMSCAIACGVFLYCFFVRYLVCFLYFSCGTRWIIWILESFYSFSSPAMELLKNLLHLYLGNFLVVMTWIDVVSIKLILSSYLLLIIVILSCRKLWRLAAEFFCNQLYKTHNGQLFYSAVFTKTIWITSEYNSKLNSSIDLTLSIKT